MRFRPHFSWMNTRNCKRGNRRFRREPRGLPRRSEGPILCGMMDAGWPAPSDEDAASARQLLRRSLRIGSEALRWTARQGSSESATNGMTIIAIRISSITRSFMNGPQVRAAFCVRRTFWRVRYCNIAPRKGKWESLQGGSRRGSLEAPAVRRATCGAAGTCGAAAFWTGGGAAASGWSGESPRSWCGSQAVPDAC